MTRVLGYTPTVSRLAGFTSRLAALIGAVALMASLPAEAQQYVFDTQNTNGTGTPSITSSTSNGNFTFAYTDTADTANPAQDSAGMSLTNLNGNAASSIITTTNSLGWIATIPVNLSAYASMPSSGNGATASYVTMGLSLSTNTSGDNLSVGLSQANNTGGTGNSTIPNNGYGTAAYFNAKTNGTYQTTTPSSTDTNVTTYNGESLIQFNGGTSSTATTEPISAVTGYVTLSYNNSSNTVTAYYNGTLLGSFVLNWGTNPSLNLSVFGSSEYVNVASGAASVTNFYANSGTPSDVGSYGMNKEINYDQTSASTPVLDPAEPYTFDSNINSGSSGALFANATLTSASGGTGTVNYTVGPGGLYFQKYFTSKSAFDAAFPNGTYNLTVQTTTPHTYNDQLTFATTDAYPTVPQITSLSSNASWVGGVLVVADVTQPVTIYWNNSSSQIYTNFNVNNIYLPNNSSFGLNSYTIPANTLMNNSYYEGQIQSNNGTGNSDATPIPYSNGAGIDFQSTVNFTIKTGTPTVSGTTFNRVLKSHIEKQSSASGPVDFTGETDNDKIGPYSLSIENSTLVSVTGPNSTSFTLAYNAYGGNNNSGDYEFDGPSETSAANLDSAYPTGSYTFGTSPTQTVNLTSSPTDPYPTAPTITAVNGNTPVWDSQGQLVLDPTVQNVITWSSVTVTNFATNGIEMFHFGSDDNYNGGNFQSIKESAGISGSSTAFTSNAAQVIPAGSMSAGSTYEGRIDYAYTPNAPSNPSTGVYYAGGYLTETFFHAVAQFPSGILQAITFPSIPSQLSTAGSVSITGISSSSGLPVTVSYVSGPANPSFTATLSNSAATASVPLTGATGTVVLQATQTGSSPYGPATPVQQSFTVGLASQTITFPGNNYNQYVGSQVTLDATASSGLPITYTITGPATFPGNATTYTGTAPVTMTFTGTGSVSVVASQPGNGSYSAAQSQGQNFNVTTATDVSSYNISKAVNYDQTAASTVVLDPREPYQFYSSVSPGNEGVVLSSTSLTPPSPSTGTIFFQTSSNSGSPGGLQFGQDFTSQAALDAAFAGGTYDFNIQTSLPNSYSETLTFPTTDSFPATPQITAVTGATWGNGILTVNNGASTVTVSVSNPGNEYTNNNNYYLNLNLYSNGNNSSNPTVNQTYSNNVTTFTITNLQSNTLYQGNITLGNYTNQTTTIPNGGDSVGFQSQVNFSLQNGSPAAKSPSFYLVSKEDVLLQTSASAPVNAADYNGNDFDTAPYTFSIQCPLSGTVTGPSSTSYPLTVDSNDSGFQYHYESAPFSSLTGAGSLDTTVPNGTYTFPGGTTVSLGTSGSLNDDFPAVPKVTAVNGSAPVWDAQGQLVLDPTVANTITWSTVNITNFSTMGHESFNFQSNGGDDFNGIDIEAGLGGSSSTFTSNASQVIAANTMTQGYTYEGTINYFQATSVANPSGSIYDVAGFQTETEFVAVALKPQTITFPTIPTQQFGGSYNVSATAYNNGTATGLPITYTITGPATFPGNATTYTGTGSVAISFLGAGQVTVTASQLGNGTYASVAPVSQTFTVNPVQLTVKVNSGGTSAYGSIPTNPGISLVSGTLQGSDTLSGLGLSDDFALTAASGAGAYTIHVTGAASLINYAVTTQNATYTVTTVPLTVKVNSGGSSTYGATPTDPGIALVSGTLYNGDTLASIGLKDSFSLTATSAANTYTINVTGSPANYVVTGQSASYTVNKAPLTITANNNSKVYWQTVTFSGSAFTSVGLQNGETIGSVTLTSTGAVDTAGVAGSPYAIVPSAATGGTFNSANYNITYDNGQLTVTKAPLTVAVNSGGSSTYGTTPTDPGISVTSGTLYPPDTLSSLGIGDSFSSLDLNSASSAGTFTIDVTGASSVANYAVTTQSASFTINKASQTISFTLGPLVYPSLPVTLSASSTSGTPVSFAVTAGGTIASVNGSVLTLSGTGPITIQATVPSSANYLAATPVSQSVTVTAAPNQTYAEWANGFTNLTDKAPGDTPEHDGVTTILKYLYGIDPSRPMTASDRAALPVFDVSSGDLTLTFAEYKLIAPSTTTQANFILQSSPDLTHWSPVTQSSNSTPPLGEYTLQPLQNNPTDANGDPFMKIDFKPPSATTRLFIRIQMTTP